MSRYLLLRILKVIPTLIIISLVGFFMSLHVPQDAAISLIAMRGGDLEDSSNLSYDSAYRELGMNKPDFYFSIAPGNYPPTLNIHSSETIRNKIKDLLRSGILYNNIIIEDDKVYVSEEVSDYDKSKNYFFLPKIFWHGMDNRYHDWLSSFFSGTFGTSLANGQPVKTVFAKAFLWTLTLGTFGIIFSFAIGILLGIFIAKNPEGRKERILGQLLYLMYAIPLFWIATMMVMYLTTDTYGEWLNIFPSVGVDIYPEKSTPRQIMANLKKFILPIFCGSLGTIAYLARMMRRSIMDELSQPYITTALSKGLTASAALKKHAFPNALLPMITIFVGAIPATLGGSVVIEVIFNIPGLGRLLYNSIGIGDWNVIFCILLVIGTITAIAYLIGDLLYAWTNPKIRFGDA